MFRKTILCQSFTFVVCLPTPWSTVLEKLHGSQLVNKFPVFYGTPSFITAFTSTRHLSLSWTRTIQSMLIYPTSWRSTSLLSSHQRLVFQGVSFPSGFTIKILYTPLPLRATCQARLILPRFDNPKNIERGIQIIKLLMMQFSPFPYYLVPPQSLYYFTVPCLIFILVLPFGYLLILLHSLRHLVEFKV
jgi:hypothetical protein